MLLLLLEAAAAAAAAAAALWLAQSRRGGVGNATSIVKASREVRLTPDIHGPRKTFGGGAPHTRVVQTETGIGEEKLVVSAVLVADPLWPRGWRVCACCRCCGC